MEIESILIRLTTASVGDQMSEQEIVGFYREIAAALAEATEDTPEGVSLEIVNGTQVDAVETARQGREVRTYSGVQTRRIAFQGKSATWRREQWEGAWVCQGQTPEETRD